LAADSKVVATLVVEPSGGASVAAPGAPPDGYQSQVSFDGRRAVRKLVPAIDPGGTLARRYPTPRHARLAAAARQLLVTYQSEDPALAQPRPSTFACPSQARRAQQLLAFLCQPYRTAEAFSSQPGESTSYAELLHSVAGILDSA
jgi:F0F1-type ATP synthase beta subunit